MYDEELEIAPEGIMCNCGNISIDSEIYCEGRHPPCSQQELAKLAREETQILIVEPGQIFVSKASKTLVVADGTQSFNLVCQDCKIGFKVLANKHHAYCCMIGHRTESSNSYKVALQSARNMASFFPLPLRPFIEVSGTPKNDNPRITSVIAKKFALEDDLGVDEPDFELMFSNKNECIVGSFTNQWMF